eukprot:m.230809 g.230809  ORF g.230809 m.230809 type:complete len:140 (+) comp12114_c0_seq1:99-518(+)
MTGGASTRMQCFQWRVFSDLEDYACSVGVWLARIDYKMVELNYVAGVLIASGGLAGYLKKGSVPSLVAGVGSGAVYVLCGYLATHGSGPTAHQVGTGVSVLLAGMMGMRAARSGKFMPAGLVATISALAGVYNGRQLAQ